MWRDGDERDDEMEIDWMWMGATGDRSHTLPLAQNRSVFFILFCKSHISTLPLIPALHSFSLFLPACCCLFLLFLPPFIYIGRAMCGAALG